MDQTSRDAGRGDLAQDPGTSEVEAEERDNTARAARIDAAFADLWAEHLRAACIQATREQEGEAGIYEACRRAFREGYHAGAAGDALAARA